MASGGMTDEDTDVSSSEEEDEICSICMDVLRDPVTTDCGHNFCLQCISQVGKTSETIQCPLCKLSVNKNTFRPNKLLASLAEKIQAIGPAEIQPEGEERRCQRHKEKLHYFCEEDGEFLCVVCRESQVHRSHHVTLMDEAAQNYKVQMESQAQDLQQKDKEIIEEKKDVKGILSRSREFQVNNSTTIPVDVERKTSKAKVRLESIIESLRKLTGKWKDKKKRDKRAVQDSLKKEELEHWSLSQEINSELLSSGKWKDKKKRDKRAVQDSLKKEELEHWSLSQEINSELLRSGDQKDKKKGDKRAFQEGPDKEELENWSLSQEINSELPSSVSVTLDTASADPDLTFSQDLKKVTLYMVGRAAPNKQSKPCPFYPFRTMRGSPGLSSGHQVWEAEIHGLSGGTSMVGVATESALVAQSQSSSAQSCIWALRVSSSRCQPFYNSNALESIQVSLKNVGVYMDYDRGRVVFYDAITRKHIYTFQTSFDGQIFPLLGLQSAPSHITLSP